MSYADAFAAAPAIAQDAVVWTGDPELLVAGMPWRWKDLRPPEEGRPTTTWHQAAVRSLRWSGRLELATSEPAVNGSPGAPNAYRIRDVGGSAFMVVTSSG